MAFYNTYSDGELVTFLRNSDTRAFTELYNRYWHKLFYVAGKKIDDLQEAENIVQDVFMDLWDRRLTLDITGSVGGYLVVAVKYSIISTQRKRYRQSTLEIREHIELSFPDSSTEALIRYHELQQQFQSELSKLPEKCGLAFSLRNDGMSYNDIAKTMDISPKTVEMHVSRALKTLRTSLGLMLLSMLALIWPF